MIYIYIIYFFIVLYEYYERYCEIFRVKMTSLYVSKILYNIILSVKNNYKLKNEKIVLWISQRWRGYHI
jgi:hypothetical protein